MGTPASASGNIVFDNVENASAALDKVREWVDKANNGLFPKDSEDNGDYEITLEDNGDNFINFSAHSQRDCNLTWQMERFNEFIKTLPGAVEFQADIMIQGDGIYWEKE